MRYIYKTFFYVINAYKYDTYNDMIFKNITFFEEKKTFIRILYLLSQLLGYHNQVHHYHFDCDLVLNLHFPKHLSSILLLVVSNCIIQWEHPRKYSVEIVLNKKYGGMKICFKISTTTYFNKIEFWISVCLQKTQTKLHHCHKWYS